MSNIAAIIKALVTFDWLVRWGKMVFQKAEVNKEVTDAQETDDTSKLEDRASRH